MNKTLIRYKLFSLIFKDDIKRNREESAAARSKQIEYEKLIKQYDFFSNLFDDTSNHSIIGIEKNELDDIMYVAERITSNDMSIELYSTNYQRNRPKLEGYIGNNYTETYEIESHYIWISDMFAIRENNGNGKILLQNLIKIAKKLNTVYDMNIIHISGELSWVDEHIFAKLKHFYEKNGFEVMFNDDNKKGRIRYNLLPE
ncbi:MAG: hypothetical protein FWG88_06630 [Oscillospiraceae bacterium]|nr:hypothetical protein [Oscillospiraceae bacterium]